MTFINVSFLARKIKGISAEQNFVSHRVLYQAYASNLYNYLNHFIFMALPSEYSLHHKCCENLLLGKIIVGENI